MHPTRRAAFLATALVLLAAFGLGTSGWPGHLVVRAVGWAFDQGYLDSSGPTGEVIEGTLASARS